MPLTVNYTGQSKIFNSSRLNRYTSLTRLENISNQYITSYKQNVGFELKNDLGLVEGIKNGVVVFGNYFRNIIMCIFYFNYGAIIFTIYFHYYM